MSDAPTVDRLSFRVEETPNSPLQNQQAAPYVNGKRLSSLLGLIWTLPEGGTVEDNIGLPPSEAFLPSRHYLDPTPQNRAATGEGVLILGCSCGVADCTYVHARIEVGEEVVRWSDFGCWPTLGPVGERFRGLRPLVFDRVQYEEALRGPNPAAAE